MFIDGMIQGVVLMPVYLLGAIKFATAGGNMTPAEVVPLMIFLACFMVFALALGLAYSCFFIRKYDATPGKLALGLKVVRTDGSKLTIWRIVGRHCAHGVTGLIPLAIGYIIAAFDAQKRALHDHMCDTRVINTR